MKFFQLIKKTYLSWKEDRVTDMAAALAYYTVFSLGPLLIICITLAGLFLGQEGAQSYILKQFSGLMGSDTAKQIQSMVQSANKPYTSWISTILGIIILFFGASGIFSQLQNGLNIIWHVENKKTSFMQFIKQRFFSLGMVLVVAFLLLVSLVISSVLTILGTYISQFFAWFSFLGEIINFLISFAIITVLFASLYKFLPDKDIQWREVFLGAILAAFLFTLGKTLLSFYLGLTNVTSAYGEAGSLIIILIWVYYSAQIVFFGAEFTKNHALSKEKSSN